MSAELIRVDEQSFQAEVLESKVPTLVDFSADWCGPCRSQQPILEQLASSYEGRARVVKVDVDRSQDLARQFSVRSIPTLLLFDQGQVVATKVGLSSSETLSELVEEAAKAQPT